jgi:hypothetical protein
VTRGFPVRWTQKYALISIYEGEKGKEGERIWIENEQLSLGGLAEFNGTPVLKLRDHKGKEIIEPSPSY